MSEKGRWIKLIIYAIIGLIIVVALIISFEWIKNGVEQLQYKLGCDSIDKLKKGEIVRVDKNLIIAKASEGRIEKELLENQKALDHLKGKLASVLEYTAQLESEVARGGGQVVETENGIEIKFSGETKALYYNCLVIAEGQKIEHYMEFNYKPIRLQIYEDNKGNVSVSSTADYLTLTIDEFRKAPPSFWSYFGYGLSAGIISGAEGYKPYLGGCLSYWGWGIEGKILTDGYGIGVCYGK